MGTPGLGVTRGSKQEEKKGKLLFIPGGVLWAYKSKKEKRSEKLISFLLPQQHMSQSYTHMLNQKTRKVVRWFECTQGQGSAYSS